MTLVDPDPWPATTPSGPTPGVFDVSAAYAEHGSVLFGFAVNALRDRGLAEDCVQETFLRAWRARDRYDPDRASTRTWLFAIARNVIIDLQRSLQRLPRIQSTDSPEHDALQNTSAGTPDPLDRLGTIEALARLSPEHREVVVAVHLTGMSYAEVSESTGVPVATLRTRAFYAMRALRTLLDDPDDSPKPPIPTERAHHDGR